MREGEDPSRYIKKQIKDGRCFIGVETEELTMPFAIKVVGNQPSFTPPTFRTRSPTSCKHDLGELMESNEITNDDKAALLYRNAERFYKLPL